MYISHPLLRENAVEEREYQVSIAKSALRGNTLVVLPTGLGKTIIAILVLVEVLQKKGGKILFLAPTKPLVEQHARTIKKLTKIEDVIVLTGEVSRKKRKELYGSAKVVVATPQIIQNDIIAGELKIGDFSLVIFDEAHRAVGNYAYVYIAKKYRKSREDHLILGITASPGGDEEKIMEIIENLGIENVEIRTEEDKDVKKYVKGFKIKWIELPMPNEIRELYGKLKELYNSIITELRKFGLFSTLKKPTRRDVLRAQKIVQQEIKDGKSEFYQAAMLITMAIKIDYALEYLETQGFEAAYNYLLRIIEEGNSKGGSKAARTLVRDERFIEMMKIARKIEERKGDIENPKLNALRVIIRKELAENKDSRIIVFTHFRETAQLVANALNEVPGVRAARFVGQASKGEDKGLRQKEQVELVEKFKKGEYNVLVATSVAEEGLDIPATDMVIFYEPVPSEIRSIQRRGRTGRARIGKVVILTIKGTRDIAYLWSSRNKEKKMKNELLWLRMLLKDKLKNVEKREVMKEEKKKKGQLRLVDFEDSPKPIIYVDTREFRSNVVKYLSENYSIVAKQFEVGDYIISDRIAIERKKVDDFLDSLKDGRLFSQMVEMRRNYEVPILIIEGESLFIRGFHENSIYGALASIISDYKIPIIFTKDARETAKFIEALMRRELGERGEVSLRKEKRAMSTEERQRYIIESLPNVSAKLSQRLLEHFGSVKDVINAEVGELIQVKGIGRKTAEEIYDIVNKKYKKLNTKN
ncbi:DEAD/DEAH box helicase [Candidatus Aciduliprofundum boonei]|uniref:DEAD/DEAH box helicase domain protein n=1 Tax=Aciduliprofundum boonei (strain DSM 19572 / T469) TaxID=439481 RepID=D3T9Y3_ACIB4|nr:DEAD/DEAH box helicase [Candidatus Aciduliprofundum boonei]ADD08912.1 DEAD/DEAH box helicase domain protein [Aciduliprofundum boonei T469]